MVIFQIKKLEAQGGEKAWLGHTESWWLHGQPYQKQSLHHQAWGKPGHSGDACAKPLASKIPDHVPT